MTAKEAPAPGGRGRGSQFTRGSAEYARFRPVYPEALFDFLASLCAERGLAWDCGAGTGQASVPLAARFERVVATDVSAGQIARAEARPDITYVVAPAERSDLESSSVDLVLAAQALHWFPFDAFLAEVKRVLKPSGILAACWYDLCSVNDAVDAVIGDYYADVVGPYWPRERRHVENGYRTVPFPFEEIPAPRFTMEVGWDLEGLLGYLGTWTATRACLEATGRDPLAGIADRLRRAWGAGGGRRSVRWPLHLRAGRNRQE
jgi:SAM-dependent methyltransferase